MKVKQLNNGTYFMLLNFKFRGLYIEVVVNDNHNVVIMKDGRLSEYNKTLFELKVRTFFTNFKHDVYNRYYLYGREVKGFNMRLFNRFKFIHTNEDISTKLGLVDNIRELEFTNLPTPNRTVTHTVRVKVYNISNLTSLVVYEKGNSIGYKVVTKEELKAPINVFEKEVYSKELVNKFYDKRILKTTFF